MKKILVIFTGGTIGSVKNENTINVNESSSYCLLDLYDKYQDKRDVKFDILQPFNILSEDLIPNDWLVLYNTLTSVNIMNYDGIIILHGTDTLPYTSAALSYLFNHTPIPIVLTASNYPIDDSRSNGLINFINSVDFILNNKISGVFVIFQNVLGDILVHIGTRLTNACTYDFEGQFNFDSFNSVPFGRINMGTFIRNNHYLNPDIDMFHQNKISLNISEIQFSSDVLYISPRPGLNYSHFDFSKVKPKAVIHNLYHAATACTRETLGNLYSLAHFTSYCINKNVDVYICPITNLSGDMYQSLRIIIDYKGIPLQNISIEAAIVKVMLAYGIFKDKDEINDFLLNKTLFFENIDCFINNNLLYKLN